jgi:hypothetical protein
MISVGIPNGSRFRILLERCPSIGALYRGFGQTEADPREHAA